MEKGNEHVATPTCPTANISTQDNQIPLHSNFSNYMHSYYMPHAWLPSPIVPLLCANPYPSYNQIMSSYPLYGEPSSPMWPTTINSRVVEEVNEATPDIREYEVTCEDDESLDNFNETKNEDSCEMTFQIVHVNDSRSKDTICDGWRDWNTTG